LKPYVIKFAELGMNDVDTVGGKNASLGEMISNLSNLGVTVPGGFATTAAAYRAFLGTAGLDKRINALLDDLDVDNIDALTSAGSAIRRWILETPLPDDLMQEVTSAWKEMSDGKDISVAVRSSATAEDLPDASFAGQQETFLNVCGLENVIEAMHHVFASLFNDRAIAYRVHQGFAHSEVALSAGIQTMVRSDLGASGVVFTLDTESGFRDAVFITSSWGLGETVVQGAVNPDEFYVYKPALAKGDHPILRTRQDRDHGRCRGIRQPFFLDNGSGHHRTRQDGRDHRKPLPASDGYRMGQGRQRWQAVHPAGASGDSTKPNGTIYPEIQAEGFWRSYYFRPQHRPENRHRYGQGDSLGCGDEPRA
jgi:phosphoenolpyruvate synthase